MNKANELLKKGLGADLQLLSNREKTLLIDARKEHYGLPELLGQLGLARSSYFYHRACAAVVDKYPEVPRNRLLQRKQQVRALPLLQPRKVLQPSQKVRAPVSKPSTSKKAESTPAVDFHPEVTH